VVAALVQGFASKEFAGQKKVLNLLPLLHHLACPITLAYLTAIVYQMEKITLACVRKVEGDHTASIFSRKAVVMAAIIMLSAFPVNVCADKDTWVTERSADQNPRSVIPTPVRMVALAVMRMPSTRISLTGGASVQTDTVEDGVMCSTHVPISSATMEEHVNPHIMSNAVFAQPHGKAQHVYSIITVYQRTAKTGILAKIAENVNSPTAK